MLELKEATLLEHNLKKILFGNYTVKDWDYRIIYLGFFLTFKARRTEESGPFKKWKPKVCPGLVKAIKSFIQLCDC